MKIILIFLSCGLLSASIPACTKPGCIGKAGDLTMQSVNLGPFATIVLDDNINLVLTQANEERVEITAPKNIIPNITTTIDQNTLHITNKGDCRWLRDAGEKINVHLFFKNIYKIDYRGSGNITNTDTLRLDSLRFESETGAGSIELTVKNRKTICAIILENADITWHGQSDEAQVFNNPRGKIDMKDLAVKYMFIEYSGLDDIYVNVRDYIYSLIYHKGNVYYKGNPLIINNGVYSTGRLIKVP